MFPIITVENLSKSFTLSTHSGKGETAVRYRRLSEELIAYPRRLLSRFSFLASRDSSEDFYALKDVSFEVNVGEVVGIIGRNGAGKSTLLKVLSRTTEPTSGRVTLRGRVASLLEVGTGFHPELTGRENIFLNGAILGMSHAEIKRKFDEIVQFAGVEQFLDTPVKRYSSGMYVRLAFAVAAHLEPEILIVDEVLAVGDSEFQKKCLGKMQHVAGQGRTVLFVSHNMGAVQSLCSRSILLERGAIRFDGRSADTIRHYLQEGPEPEAYGGSALSGSLTLRKLRCSPASVQQHKAVTIHLELTSTREETISDLAVLVNSPRGERVSLIDLRPIEGFHKISPDRALDLEIVISAIPFVENDYALGLYVNSDSVCQCFDGLLNLAVLPGDRQDAVIPRDCQFRGVVELQASVLNGRVKVSSFNGNSVQKVAEQPKLPGECH